MTTFKIKIQENGKRYPYIFIVENRYDFNHTGKITTVYNNLHGLMYLI
jgi:hypothetical protein